MTEDKEAEACAIPGPQSVPRFEPLLATICAIEDSAQFEPLDETIDQDTQLLRTVEMDHLLQRCKGQVAGLGGTWRPYVSEWCQALTTERLAHYCGLLTNLFEGLLLKSGRQAAHILDSAREPKFVIFPVPTSILAQESGIHQGQVVLGVGEIARYLANRSNESYEFGEIAWRSLAMCLRECQESPFPGVELRALSDGRIELRLIAD